jgi:5-methylcytosine-specific restriction endonuclease McrA
MEYLKCTRCKISKPLDSFYPSSHHKNGILPGCKECRKKRARNEYDGKYHQQRLQNLTPEQKLKRTQQLSENARKRRKNPDVRLKEALRARIYNSMQDNKDRSTLQYLGCTISEYKSYLEKQFTPEMNWQNWGELWEIDHIKPLSKGGTFNYTNTQPLIKEENRKKSNKY